MAGGAAVPGELVRNRTRASGHQRVPRAPCPGSPGICRPAPAGSDLVARGEDSRRRVASKFSGDAGPVTTPRATPCGNHGY